MARWSIALRPALSATLWMRSASRGPGLPQSIRTDSPAGVTISVAAPPSVSMKWMSRPRGGSAAKETEPQKHRDTEQIREKTRPRERGSRRPLIFIFVLLCLLCVSVPLWLALLDELIEIV